MNRYKDHLYFLKNLFLKTIFPPKCVNCGQLFWAVHPSHPNPNPIPSQVSSLSPSDIFARLFLVYLCQECVPLFEPVSSPVCLQCGVPFKSRFSQDHTCGDCITSPRYFDKVRTVGVYRESLKELIHQFKFSGKVHLADPLSTLLYQSYEFNFSNETFDYITSVPLHLTRQRKRGYNQAHLLIQKWPNFFSTQNDNCEVKGRIKQVLIRTEARPPQAELNKKMRLKNLKGAFQVTDADLVKGKSILLADDVFTTGATIDECARILKKAGAKYIAGITLARAL